MFTIVKRRKLNPTVTELCIHAPLIAKKAKAGQFIIVRAKEDSERISLTIAGFDREAGTVSGKEAARAIDAAIKAKEQ